MRIKLFTSLLIVTSTMLPKTLLLDGDGVIWIESVPLPGVVDALNEIRSLGVRLVLVTNNSSKTREEYLRVIESIGLQGFTKEDVFSSGFAVALYLKDCGISRVFVSGYSGLIKEIRMAGITVFTDRLPASEEAQGVEAIVASKSPNFTFDDLSYAISLQRRYKCRLIGTNPDPNYPVPHQRILPGSGAAVACFESALDTEATVVGKPEDVMFEKVLEYTGCTKDEVMMVGDRICTDVKFASRHGARSVLVLSGVDTMKDVEEAEDIDKPTYVLPSLVEVAELLKGMGKA